jgi:hypothetical protein
MARRSYTDEQRGDALKLYQQVGPAEAGRRLGIPSTTVRQWAKRAGASSPRAEHVAAAVRGAQLTWGQRRAELADQAGEAAEEFLCRARASNPSNAAFFMRCFDLATKNANLISSEPTSREQQRTHAEIDREVEELIDHVRREAIMEAQRGDSVTDRC